ncbi:MAG: hypothetical protein ACXAEF_02475 [Candidatus Thorarchaeota archaeon]|jgi:hypothetical protein
MSGENESGESDGISLNRIAQLFFDPDESYWPVFAVLVAISIFSMWTIRSAFESILAVAMIVIYAIVSLTTIRFKYRKLEIRREERHVTFFFERKGVSWKFLLQVVLGAAIPLLLAWFVLHNSVLDSSDLAEYVMLVAMLLYIGIIPLTPAFANSQLRILKTTLLAKVDLDSYEFLQLEMEINPLDGYWYENRDDPDFIDALRSVIVSTLNEQESV